MSKHTPGPWRVVEKPNNEPPYCRMIDGPEMDEIAYIRGPFDWDLQEANARLIAAAPDLLEACKAWMDDPNGPNLERMSAAIRKAEASEDKPKPKRAELFRRAPIVDRRRMGTEQGRENNVPDG